MDFDELAQSTANDGTRRALLRLLAGGTLGVVAARLGVADGTEARHKKKRKKKGARCMSLRQSCAGTRCCGALGCGDNGCDGGNTCFQHAGGGCNSDCDCRGDLNCSERHGDTCQACGYPETPCGTTSDCCLDSSICGYNGCGPYQTVCCQWDVGSLCYDDCDCCAELGCFGGLCLPLLTEDGSERQKRGSDAAAEQPAKGRWPRR